MKYKTVWCVMATGHEYGGFGYLLDICATEDCAKHYMETHRKINKYRDQMNIYITEYMVSCE